MTTLPLIVAACLAGGVLSIVAAAGTLALHHGWISRLVSFAVGALLGAVFLELLPHALERSAAEPVMLTMLAGLLLFFLLEKLVLWRHSHGEADTLDDVSAGGAQPAGHDHGRSGLMILIGNSVHNLCDGIVIAAAFVADVTLGATTTLAIVAHAVPQQVGDFAVLLHSGFTRRRAFATNLTTGVATLAGGLLGYAALASMQHILPSVLALASASLLYVAVADLIPSLHRHPAPAQTAQQLVLIGIGIALIAAAHVALKE
ncbi:MAG: ZIP family metal transporter [Betaproteobacteria bacterium]|nr:MAG: ZIP family metal transporter [Betaproteobacteria bacterium]